MNKIKIYFSLVILLAIMADVSGQCAGAGSQTDAGAGSWIGHVYEGVDNFTDYRGQITESQNFDDTFCNGANCDFTTNSCTVTANYFTVRYRMNETLTSGIYRITVGGDDGYRLSLDNGSTYIINNWNYHSYTTEYLELKLSGSYNMVFEYFENDGDSRVSFNIEYLGVNWGGQVSADQNICESTTVDPDPFTSITPALFDSEITPTYQWEVSEDNVVWADVAGATSEAYDIPSGFGFNTRYYRRRADAGAESVNSAVLTVIAQQSEGDPSVYGAGSWIGYVYDGRDNYNYADYLGEVFETEEFDESFGGDNVTSSTSGCDYQTETFTVRFRMTKTFNYGEYSFTIGADDGVRLSIDGGATWLIDDYSDHGYRTASASGQVLDGSYDLVLEYYENGGGNRVTFDYSLDVPLPVIYLGFGAEQNGNQVAVNWSTASEQDNDYFDVERADNSGQWAVVSTVKGNGTTKEVNHYQFVDKIASASSEIYYRLKQVDFDGEYEYSKVVVVAPKFYQLNVEVYPNPATTYVQLDGGSKAIVHVQVFDMAGSLVKDGTEAEVYVGDLQTGQYILRCYDLSGQPFAVKQLMVQ